MLSSVNPRDRLFLRLMGALPVLAFLVCLPVLAGCATTVNNSDIPWNDPQPWEGSPAIPGLSNGGSGCY